jgi:tetratricopeptide (TPR) repeat protein
MGGVTVKNQRGNPIANPDGGAAWGRTGSLRGRRLVRLIVVLIMSTTLSPAFLATANPIDVVGRSSTAPASFGVSLPKLYLQTMNNCGPATLSMVFAYYGVDQSQQAIGNILRPFQDPTGMNDNKGIFMDEMAAYADSNGFAAFHRVNGDLDTLRALVSHNLPVVVQTQLDPNGDIGHFRIVTGYSDAQQRIIQTDPYRGANLSYSYGDFQTMWQPYGYEYLVIVPKDDAALVTSLLGAQSTEASSWQGLLDRSQQEQAANGTQIPALGNAQIPALGSAHNPYPVFNQAKAYYHLGRYAEAKTAYESVASQLPPRTLWYQLEPMQLYQKLGEDKMVLSMTDAILNHGNRAFPELYYIQAQVYVNEGNIPTAKEKLGSALYYNKNYQLASDLLKSLG